MNARSFLLVLSSLEIGGAETQAINFAIFLKKHGYTVDIIAPAKEGKVCEVCELFDIPCQSLGKPNKALFFLYRLLRKIHIFSKEYRADIGALSHSLGIYIKKKHYDVCVAYCNEACLLLGYSIKYYTTPYYIWYQRDAGIQGKGNKYELQAIKAYDCVLANSRGGKEYIHRCFDIDAKVIPNGVELRDAEMEKNEWKKKLHLADVDLVCTMVANLHSYKDHMTILKIWVELKNRDLMYMPHLILAGRKDNEYSNLIQFAETNELMDYVYFTGAVNDITGLLSITDIFVFGAKSEGSPNAIIEACLMELPVVATNLPEICDVLSDANIPYLFEKNDIEKAADNIVDLIDHKDLRIEIGKKNKEKCKLVYDKEKNFNMIIDLVENS